MKEHISFRFSLMTWRVHILFHSMASLAKMLYVYTVHTNEWLISNHVILALNQFNGINQDIDGYTIIYFLHAVQCPTKWTGAFWKYSQYNILCGRWYCCWCYVLLTCCFILNRFFSSNCKWFLPLVLSLAAFVLWFLFMSLSLCVCVVYFSLFLLLIHVVDV